MMRLENLSFRDAQPFSRHPPIDFETPPWMCTLGTDDFDDSDDDDSDSDSDNDNDKDDNNDNNNNNKKDRHNDVDDYY